MLPRRSCLEPSEARNTDVARRICPQLCPQLQAAPCRPWLIPTPLPSVGWKGWASASSSALHPSSGVHVTFHTQPDSRRTPPAWEPEVLSEPWA